MGKIRLNLPFFLDRPQDLACESFFEGILAAARTANHLHNKDSDMMDLVVFLLRDTLSIVGFAQTS
jgi:hypothetical protein